jgi:uncharacterized protein
LKLANRVCVVTGASSGIGRGAAGTFAANGARVCLVARRKPRLEQVLAEIGGEGAGHSLFVCDVSQRDQVAALADFVRSTYDRCDVLVNNAGYSTDGTFEGPGDVERFEQVMAVNFYGTLFCTGELLPVLIESAPSNIVNVASMAGRLGLAGNSSYCASKFAMVGLSESLHIDLAPRGVCVSLIEPGLIPTEGFPQSERVAHPVMKHALGTIEDVTEAILDAVVNRKMERVVPRWYYLLQVPRLLAPPLYRWAGRKLIR